MPDVHLGWPQYGYLAWFLIVNAWWLMLLTYHKRWRGCWTRIATLALVMGLVTCGGFFTSGAYSPLLALGTAGGSCAAFGLWVGALAWLDRWASGAKATAVAYTVESVIARQANNTEGGSS